LGIHTPVDNLFICNWEPSLISAKHAKQVEGEESGVTTHDFRVYEMRANKNTANYFGKFYGVDWLTLYRSGTYYPRAKR
jgi:hypothetical protein